MALDHLTVRETAGFLQVSEKTVYRWIRQGVIPSFKFQGQYRFGRKELEAWANYKRIGGVASGQGSPAEQEEENPDLLEAVRRGGIHYRVEGATPEEINANLVRLLPFGPGATEGTRAGLASELSEREAMATTGLGNGFALPHPRHPRDWGLGAPATAIFFLERPVDFQAHDGLPVSVLFVVLCSTIKGHLQILSQVGHLLSDPGAREYFLTTPKRTEMMEKIRSVLESEE